MTEKRASFTLRLAALVGLVALTSTMVLRDMRTVQYIDDLLDWFQGTEECPYLQGNFAPVADEHRGVALPIMQGALPPDLAGIFVRNGPNPIPGHTKKKHHWFDGHGMVHTVRIHNGTAIYSNSFIPTPRYEIEKEQGKEVFTKLGEIVGLTGLLKILLLSEAKVALLGLNKLTSGQANTHVLMYQNKFYALHEGSLPFEVKLMEDGSVEAIGHETFDGVLNYPVSAHPKIDFENDNLVFHGYAADPQFVKQDGTMKVGEKLASSTGELEYYYGVTGEDGITSFSHDMMFTKHWVILFDTSVIFDAKGIMSGSVFQWNEQRNLRIALVPRTEDYKKAWASDVVWMDVGSPHMVVHPLNAWEEEDGMIVIWMPLGDHFTMDLSEGGNVFYMTELKLDPKTGTVTGTRIDDEYNVEFSRVRDDCMGKFARFGYTAFSKASDRLEGFFDGFVVWDMERRALHKVVHFPKGEVGGEPVLIPKPGTSGSGEVYVGVFLYKEEDNTSSFILYDGETAAEEPVAKLHVPNRVPFGFHGRWVDEMELQNHIRYHASKKTESV